MSSHVLGFQSFSKFIPFQLLLGMCWKRGSDLCGLLEYYGYSISWLVSISLSISVSFRRWVFITRGSDVCEYWSSFFWFIVFLSFLSRIYKKAGLLKNKKEEVTYVVCKKGSGKRVRRPAGVQGRFKVVDHRMKKDMNAAKRVDQKKGKKGGKAKKQHHHSRR